jgi:putative hydrolase of the HAD superfamily
MIKLISFDLQGTLSKSNFSDYFWLDLLPKKYSEKFNISIKLARKILKEKFKELGIYNILYYDDKYWSEYLGFNTLEELEKFAVRPEINNEVYKIIKDIKIPKIIISTTTNLFINYELKEKVNDFDKIYSCVDYFKSGGKTKKIYEEVCKEFNVNANEVIHIGDSKTMDFDNAKEAGINAILYENDINKLKDELNKWL